MADTDKTYNGWSNYATWRINLEILSDLSLEDDFGNERDAYDLSQRLEDYVSEILDSYGTKGLIRDYADAFVSEVNWYEIAEHMIADADPLPSEDEPETEDAD